MRALRALKTILTVLLLATALLAAGTALFWRALLTPAQKVHYGLHFSANADYAARAAAHRDDPLALSNYVQTLVATGNLGRAAYLCGLYGVQDEQLDALRGTLQRGMQAQAAGQVYDYMSDLAVQEVADLPAGQALRFLQGYQYALSGDWASAKNHFAAIEVKKLAPQLRPYLTYYLARSYRLAGSAAERGKVTDMLSGLTVGKSDKALSGKAQYNLLAWYLSDEYAQVSGGKSATGAADGVLDVLKNAQPVWAAQKGYTEFGEYYLKDGDIVQAWELATQALALGIEDPSGKAAGELCAAALEQALHSKDEKVLGANGALKLELPGGTIIYLARCAALHGFEPRVIKLYRALKDHVTDRPRWEELRAGLAVCYGSLKDVQSFKALMADANLRDLSDASLSEIYFEYAALLEKQEQWNDALSYYKSAAKLDGSRAGEALYRCYAILKQVTQPLNLDSSVGYLQQVIEQHPGSNSMPKAVEELLPILIYTGRGDAARQLCQWVLDYKAGEGAAPARERELEQLREVAHYWLGWLADKRGDVGQAAKQRKAIPCKYWNYYELASNFPPAPALPAEPQALGRPESAGEFLAGLGLDDPAREYYAATGDADNPVLLYCELANRALSAPLYTRQYEATQLLESGVLGEQALLDFTLAEAYPQPYQKDVAAAAGRFGVPKALVYAVIKKESNFREDAVSWVGAQGLMQLMPATVQWLIGAGRVSVSYAQRQQPAANIELGCAYLAHLKEQLGGDVRAMIHSYNGGTGNYQKWAAQYSGASGALFTELVPNEENETFAKNVYKYMKIYEWRESSGQQESGQ